MTRLLRLFGKAPGAFWRHDVDLSLHAAAQMAQVAQLAGVQSTFYILATGDPYNPFSRDSAHHLGMIRTGGHTLGLHVDCRDGQDPHRRVDEARRLFYAAYPGLFDLDQVSFHIPPSWLLWKDYEGFDSAYASHWEGHYLSDSRGGFSEQQEALVAEDMQINLHPEWWFPCA